MLELIHQRHEHTYKVLFLLCSLFIIYAPLEGQDSAVTAEPTAIVPATIEFTGTISNVTDTHIIVNGLTVTTANVDIEGTIAVGMYVEIEGRLLADGTVQATEIEQQKDNDHRQIITPTASWTPATTPVPDSTRTLNPPPIMPSGTPSISPTSTPDDDDPDDNKDNDVLIVIEGPIEAININIVIIYGFEIVLDDDDPILTVIRVGDVIRVEGTLRDDDDDDENTIFVIVAVDITFINVIVIIIDGRIWREPDTCEPLPGWVPTADVEIYIARCSQDDGGYGGNNSPGRNDNDDDDDDGDDDDD